jgi:hypothetical protein
VKRLAPFALVVGLLLTACTTTSTRVADAEAPKPAAGSQVLLLEPDVQLGLLTASGITEPRADWSKAAREHLSREIAAQLTTRAHGLKMVDPEAAMDGRSGQLLRLNNAVGHSILLFNYGGLTLPTKGKDLDWTLGEGVKVLADAHGAQYALFVNASGNYASGGRMAASLGMAMLGVAMPLGQQTVIASLVDLKTGQVVWFNFAVAGPNADMREPEGAATLTASLLKDIPL